MFLLENLGISLIGDIVKLLIKAELMTKALSHHMLCTSKLSEAMRKCNCIGMELRYFSQQLKINWWECLCSRVNFPPLPLRRIYRWECLYSRDMNFSLHLVRILCPSYIFRFFVLTTWSMSVCLQNFLRLSIALCMVPTALLKVNFVPGYLFFYSHFFGPRVWYSQILIILKLDINPENSIGKVLPARFRVFLNL